MSNHQITLAWAFRSRHSLEQMRGLLDAAWPKPWSEGDSARLGDYLGGRLTEQAVARIYRVQDGGYVVNLRFYSLDNDPLPQLELAKRQLLDQALPLIEATDVDSTDALE